MPQIKIPKPTPAKKCPCGAPLGHTGKHWPKLVTMAIIATALFLGPFWANAEVFSSASVRFNNENIHTTTHPAPIGQTFEFGDLTIIPLEDGKTLMIDRYILEPEYGVSIFRYQIDDAFWFVTNKGVIYGENSIGMGPMASTSLQALSIYLTL